MKKIEDYLHLYLGCNFITSNSQGQVNAVTISSILKYLPEYKNFKLILRPLSSMTEEERKELWPEVSETDKGITMHHTYEGFRKMLSKGFDLFGLLDSNLAIEKP